MSLTIYNSLTRRKENFTPIHPPHVRMYVCGITAYDESHLGHARAAVVFDTIYRYLLYRKYDVTYVRNFTDVDDKIIKKANDSGLSCEAVSEKYIQSYTEVMKNLGVQPPHKEPRASLHIQEMLDLIRELEQKGFAYQVGGDVLYSVRSFQGYGNLSHKKIDELESGARVGVDEKKKDPLDFVLWKGAKPGEPKWASPWGEGRPGWHLECSAMSMKYLGESFDIHGGGRDLIFPHHENEIAQSEAATGNPFVRYWIHNGFVNIDQEKMSKSLGNIKTVRNILSHWPSEAVRFFLLSSHYRSPLNFNESVLDDAAEAVTRFYETLARLKSLPAGSEPLPEMNLLSTFEKNLDDDFNTAQFIGTLFNRLRRLNSWLDKQTSVDPASRDCFFEELQKSSTVLGIFGEDPVQFLEKRKKNSLVSSQLAPEQVESKIRERLEAKRLKDWQRADALRKELLAKGIELRDNPDGTTTWTVK
ncbi:MAG: cysteine--tRNA ligase [Deltaproteobacteria bacterium]|nr:cysteine--tRNA ligase [Deltaproteobacteria bacterium]MBI4197450.1 cysteine--tRNA ligase [Deltaproteobacteria bacterium]